MVARRTTPGCHHGIPADPPNGEHVSLETFYLFLALAILTALGAWLNLKARSSNFLKAFTITLVVSGALGMLYLTGTALLT